ncbi:sigma 54 interacting domain-containing protein [Clostridium tetanomorphum DSM 665]|nr:sigma 54 interacting domain-containing protein [Clostridium tetanomorphum DSM 665]
MYITLKNVFLKYGETTIFENLNYCFNDGVYLIKGKSGIGKTTLLNLIAGYLFNDSGDICKEDAQISYMMQETILFNNLTVKDNIYIKYILNNQFNEKDFNEFIIKNTNDIGLSSNLLNKQVSCLSGGQKRKLELLLLSLNKSNVLLLDEPVANLDEDSINQIILYIEDKLLNNKIIIISSHSHIDFKSKTKNLVLLNGAIIDEKE